jgi:SARP family transcriptional regulator, regulator of embCAB operon
MAWAGEPAHAVQASSRMTAATEWVQNVPQSDVSRQDLQVSARRSVLATVMFTDIVGSSEHAAEIGDRGWGDLVQGHHDLVREQLEQFDGRELDTAGDGFFASFDRPAEAVRCACAVSDGVRSLGVQVRVGVHTGECAIVGKKVAGLAVHIGARVAATALPGEVLVTGTVKDLVAGSELQFSDRGVHALRGIPGEWRLFSVEREIETARRPVKIQLCGHIAVEVDGRRVEDELPGRQGRMLFAYLAANRLRWVTRDELIDALWPDASPAATDAALRSLLSKLRHTFEVRAQSGQLRLELPQGARIDLEAAREAIHRAESALAQAEWARAWGASQVALFPAQRGFLPGEDAPWIDGVRRWIEELRVRALETYTLASLGLGNTELASAERAARELIALAPYRESGYRHLMSALAKAGNRAEALRVYEDLRKLLKEELGISPSAETQELHGQILRAEPAPPPVESSRRPPPASI